MKFIIDIEEFWLEEEDLTDALQSHLLTSVTLKISKSIEDQVENQITKKVTSAIEKNISSIIDKKLNELIETGTIKYNQQEVTITQHIKNLFTATRGWNGVGDQIDRFSKRFCAEMKLQYDAAFATKIVMGLKEQNLLKPEVVQILLEDKDKK